MNKDIKDCLHYYLGCEVEYYNYISNAWCIGILRGVTDDYAWIKDDGNGCHFSDLKPILRPLSDMSEEEAGWVYNYSFQFGLTTQLGNYFDYDIRKIMNEDKVASLDIRRIDRPHHSVNILMDGTSIVFNDEEMNEKPKFCWRCMNGAIQFHYLLSKHFDIFGLIEEGLAIDKTII